MALVVWITMGIALWHFTVFLPERFWQGIVGAFLGSVIGAVVFGLIIELISHASRLLSLSLRLFGNIFGEELVILILGSIVPFIVPLPMMFLGLITGGLQAFIFVLLSIIYLQGAVAVEHEQDGHGHDAPTGIHAPAAA